MKYKKCLNCGTDNELRAKFCRKCGAPFINKENINITKNQETGKKQEKHEKIIIFTLIVIIFFVISGLSASIINTDSNSYNNVSGDSGVSTTTHSSQSNVKEVSSSFPTGLIFPDEFTFPFDSSQDNQQNIVDSESSSSISNSNDYSSDSGDSDGSADSENSNDYSNLGLSQSVEE